MNIYENQEKTFVAGQDFEDDLLERKNEPVKETTVVLVIDDENEFDDLI